MNNSALKYCDKAPYRCLDPLYSCACGYFLSFDRERKTGGMKLKGREGKKPRRRHTDVSAVLFLQRLIGNF